MQPQSCFIHLNNETVSCVVFGPVKRLILCVHYSISSCHSNFVTFSVIWVKKCMVPSGTSSPRLSRTVQRAVKWLCVCVCVI